MSEEKVKSRKPVFEIVKSVIVAVILSLVLILLAALLIKVCNIPTSAIPVINQVIKAVSVLVACLLCLKVPQNGWLKGIAVGLMYIVIAFVIFSLLDGAFDWSLKILNDVAIGSVTGAVSGIIAANIRK